MKSHAGCSVLPASARLFGAYLACWPFKGTLRDWLVVAVQVNGRVLDTPRLQYGKDRNGNEQHLDPGNKGAWNIMNQT